jgi:NADPH:quinone reductase-like Zn-dependent oxidoreductase
MRAVAISGFGPPSKVQFTDVPMPSCEPNDVVVKVAAAGVNPVDWKECEGHLQAFYTNYPDPWVIGYDAAGTIHTVGGNVKGYKPGDRVVVFSDRRDNGHNGTFAEYVRVASDAVAHVPPSVDLVDAAAIPVAGLTGYQILFRPHKAGLKAGDSVLIHGASGGVGSYAVQFAKARGIHVAATCSAKNVDYVKSLGADLVIDYAKGNIVADVRKWRSEGVHAVIDGVGGGTLPDALDALRLKGRVLCIATLTQDDDPEAEAKRAAARGFTWALSIIEFDRINQDLSEMIDLMAKGLVKPPPLTIYPLNEGAKALQHSKDGGIKGKIVLKV